MESHRQFLHLFVCLTACMIIAVFATACNGGSQETAQAPAETQTMAQADDDAREYDVLHTTGAITLDGKMDEADWARAEEVELRETASGDPVPLKSTVKVLWDDEYVYAGFYCEDSDAWATIEEFDGPLWGEEVVEVFIDPENEQHTYYEIEISPINNIVDLFVTNIGEDRGGRYKGWVDWSFEGLKSAVDVEGDGKNEGTNDTYWSVEVAIPFADIWTATNRPPKDGDMWRMNFYRIERGDSKSKDDDFYAAFNPTTKINFHMPWNFGKLYFRK